MVLYLVGLGLADEKDISIKGLEAVKSSERVYLEAYTSLLLVGTGKLEEFYGKKLIVADREMVESEADSILKDADVVNVSFLVVGDPYGATTHTDLVLRAKERGIQAIDQLLEVETRRKGNVYSGTTIGVGLARVGSVDAKIVVGTLEQLRDVEFGAPLHSLVIPGQMHPLEIDLVETFAIDRAIFRSNYLDGTCQIFQFGSIPEDQRQLENGYVLRFSLIQENRIPEFDNLYLDMNGIIHPCSHPNDGDAHFRITEQEIYQNIFDYVDNLFNTIKPRKLLFMAVDGVAPRAKINQQRARRFQTAREAQELREKALSKGQTLPDSDPFDSNSITPGTLFMTKLSEQLKWYANVRVSEDPKWKGVEVILSGHDVPGEGEHKIMEYLRLAKSSPDYEHNTRHCVYGLDADLIMLGLLTHEPHFALLREKVTFSRKRASTKSDAQEFYLLHLSLMREYLNLEFLELNQTLPFRYDLERIIDDFILMCYFVGNDFLPNLPNLHIREGALNILFDAYKRVLPQGTTYLHDSGILNLELLQKLIVELGDFERQHFQSERTDLKWLAAKARQQPNRMDAKQAMTPTQKDIFENIKGFVDRHSVTDRLAFQPSLPARDRAFIARLAKELGLNHSYEVGPHNTRQMMVDWDSDEDDSDEESGVARSRVLKRWDKVTVREEDELADEKEKEIQERLEQEFRDWKKTYYKEKMSIEYGSEQMKTLIYHYIEGIQYVKMSLVSRDDEGSPVALLMLDRWVLHYYYSGVISWGWFYPYYYTPMITDITEIAGFTFHFEIGTPFKPFEQLMGVLPAASQALVPECYRDLMTDFRSPIHDFYPSEFETDLNGKKNGWEAIVKIPFIDEKRLWAAMKRTFIEKSLLSRDSSKSDLLFSKLAKNNLHSPNALETATAILGIFVTKKTAVPPIHHLFRVYSEVYVVNCHTVMSQFNLPILGERGFVRGLLSNTRLGIRAQAGFPSLDTLPITGALGFHSVRVFEMDSRNESMILTLINRFDNVSPEEIALQMIGSRVFVGWPFLIEALATSVVDEFFVYTVSNNGAGIGAVVKSPHSEDQLLRFQKEAHQIEGDYSKRFAVIVGPVEAIVRVRLLQGMRHMDDGSVVKYYSDPGQEGAFAVQTIVDTVECEDTRYTVDRLYVQQI
ncbi:hypothetical protein HDU93_005275 [Gonapodya sp. JEL0774]|nr:hypothetical protein HDU93_005275 [Gonapodya sp. JEL0774]